MQIAFFGDNNKQLFGGFKYKWKSRGGVGVNI
jgi:hypothetical protein